MRSALNIVHETTTGHYRQIFCRLLRLKKLNENNGGRADWIAHRRFAGIYSEVPPMKFFWKWFLVGLAFFFRFVKAVSSHVTLVIDVTGTLILRTQPDIRVTPSFMFSITSKKASFTFYRYVRLAFRFPCHVQYQPPIDGHINEPLLPSFSSRFFLLSFSEINQ